MTIPASFPFLCPCPLPCDIAVTLTEAVEYIFPNISLGFLGHSVLKNPHANAGDSRDAGSVPGLGRFPGVGNGYSSILAWNIQWTGKPGGLQSMGDKEFITVYTHYYIP